MHRIKLVIKYDYIKAISKNNTTKRSSSGMYKPKVVKGIQNDIRTLVRGAINATDGRVKFRDGKVWVKIMVYRKRDPFTKGPADVDPINFLDGVADAVEKAIGVNDKGFSSVVDWAVDPDDPRVEIVVEQESEYGAD